MRGVIQQIMAAVTMSKYRKNPTIAHDPSNRFGNLASRNRHLARSARMGAHWRCVHPAHRHPQRFTHGHTQGACFIRLFRIEIDVRVVISKALHGAHPIAS